MEQNTTDINQQIEQAKEEVKTLKEPIKIKGQYTEISLNIEEQTFTWKEIEEAIEENTNAIVEEVKKLKLIPQLPNDHYAQKVARFQRIEQILKGSNTTKEELQKILFRKKEEQK